MEDQLLILDGKLNSFLIFHSLQFFLAPHDLEGKNPKPELRPVSIGNSYGVILSFN